MNKDVPSYYKRIWNRLKRAWVKDEDVVNSNISNSHVIQDDGETGGTPNKVARIESGDQTVFIDSMKKILTCTVCFEIRKQSNQCQNGHLICINCTLSMQQSVPTGNTIFCPVCRVPINKAYQRSLLAEQLINELPIQCQFCSMVTSSRNIEQHETVECFNRSVSCEYALFGCDWKGLAGEKSNHEDMCNIGLSKVSTISELVNTNMRNQLRYYEKRNAQWNNLVNKLREQDNGFQTLLKQIVVIKYAGNRPQKQFRTTKFQIINQDFSIKFKISATNDLTYKLVYNGEDKLAFLFFINSVRYDDEIYELTDNLHNFSFDEDHKTAGPFILTITKLNCENKTLVELIKDKDHLYFEMITNHQTPTNFQSINANGTLENNDALNGQPNNSNPSNLVVALISSEALQNQVGILNANNDDEGESDDNDSDNAEEEEEEDQNEDDSDDSDEEGEDAFYEAPSSCQVQLETYDAMEVDGSESDDEAEEHEDENQNGDLANENKAVVQNDLGAEENKAVVQNDLGAEENEAVVQNDLGAEENEAVIQNDLVAEENEAVIQNDSVAEENGADDQNGNFTEENEADNQDDEVVNDEDDE